MTIRGGCGAAIAVWLALIGAYFYVAWDKFHEIGPAAVVAILGGTFASILLSSFIGLFTGRRDRGALRRAIDGEAPRDGRLEAAAGPIRPTGIPLVAPFSGLPCVAYEYDVKREAEGQSDYAGVALAPAVVDTLRGPVKMLGWSMLDEFPYTEERSIDRQRGSAYLGSASFEPLGLTTMISVLGDLLTDDDGAVRKDFRIAGEGGDLGGRLIKERIVPVGATVTLLGKWSDARGGFAPSGTSINRLFATDLATTKKKVGGSAVKTFFIGLFFFVVLHSILGAIYLAPNGRGSASASRSVWDERDCDRQKTLLAAGADPNERGQSGETALMNAARMDEPACVQQLIAAGAKLETRDENGETALAQAIRAGRDENVAILVRAGAKDFRVTEANGDPVTDDAAPYVAVKDYIAAVHGGDLDAMARLTFGGSVERLRAHSDDLTMWQSLRPKEPRLVRGWMNERAATIAIAGTAQSGEQRITYHLESDARGWRIRYEWFVDK